MDGQSKEHRAGSRPSSEKEGEGESRPERECQLLLLSTTPPQCPVPSTGWQSSFEERYRAQLTPFFLQRLAQFYSKREIKTLLQKLEGDRREGRSAREMCPRYDATFPTGLWCGNKHIITAVSVPTLWQCHKRSCWAVTVLPNALKDQMFNVKIPSVARPSALNTQSVPDTDGRQNCWVPLPRLIWYYCYIDLVDSQWRYGFLHHLFTSIFIWDEDF